MKILMGKKDIEQVIQDIVAKTLHTESDEVKQLNGKIKTIELQHDQKIDNMVKEYEDLEKYYYAANDEIKDLKEQLETHKSLEESLTKEKDFHIEQENKWKDSYEKETERFNELKDKFDNLYRKYCLTLDKEEIISKQNDTYKGCISDIKSAIEDAEIDIEDIENEEE